MKICTKCKTPKELSEFGKEKKVKSGYTSSCRVCLNESSKNSTKTKSGIIVKLYSTQIRSSKDRGHNPPSYTKDELSQWLLNDWLFDLLYTNWVNCGYIKSMIPSIDRLDDSKGYSFDNIQIMTWGENYKKFLLDIRSCKTIHISNPQKTVLQYTKGFILINSFISVRDAERQTGINSGNISRCCNSKQKTSGGFIWKFKKTT